MSINVSGPIPPPSQHPALVFSPAEAAALAEGNQPSRVPVTAPTWLENSNSSWPAPPPQAPGPLRSKESQSTGKIFRILIADDHEAVRRGLRSALLGAGWQVCGEAYDGKEAIQKVRALKPDLVILDISMPNLSGLEAAREILRLGEGTKVLIFTMHESRQIRAETAALGVHGIAVKSAPLSTLLATIDSILRPS